MRFFVQEGFGWYEEKPKVGGIFLGCFFSSMRPITHRKGVGSGFIDRAISYANSASTSGGAMQVLKIPSIPYTDEDKYGEPNLAGDGQPGDGKAAVNGIINMWNGTVDFVSSPIETSKQTISSISSGISGGYNEIRNNGFNFLNRNVTDENRLQRTEMGFSMVLGFSLGLAAKPNIGYLAAKRGMTELQLVTKAAQKAEAAIRSSGGVAETLNILMLKIF